MSIDDADRDDRTVFVSGLTEKVTEKLLYELMLVAGPIERVSIPKESDGKNRTYGFITYVHESSVVYSLNIFAGTKLFGRELLLKFRNAKNNKSNQESPLNTPSSMINPFNASYLNFNLMPMQQPMIPQQPILTQEMIQQRILQMATMPDFGMPSFANYTSPSLDDNLFPSTRQDSTGSHRERHSRNDESRNRTHDSRRNNNRSHPYRRSRSRSPFRNNRERSPTNNRSSNRNSGDRERRRDRGSGNGNYSRWNY